MVKSKVFVCLPRIGSGSDSVTNTRFDSTGSIPSSPSLNRSAAPTALYVIGPKPSGTVSAQEKLFDSFAEMSKLWSGTASPSAASTAFPVRASARLRRTLPTCRVADWLLTFTVNSSTSPSRKNRGGFGCTIKSLAVTTLSSSDPDRICLSWAKAWNFHFVRASGIVNSIRTVPDSSAIRCGKKNAVSRKFDRAATSDKSGPCVGGGAALPSDLSNSVKLLVTESSFALALFITAGAPAIAPGPPKPPRWR